MHGKIWKEKLSLKLREDVETRPVEVSFQSTGAFEEVQMIFREEDDLGNRSTDLGM